MQNKKQETRRSQKIKIAKHKKIFAISQIASLVLEIIAFAFLFSLGFGLSVGGVSGLEEGEIPEGATHIKTDVVGEFFWKVDYSSNTFQVYVPASNSWSEPIPEFTRYAQPVDILDTSSVSLIPTESTRYLQGYAGGYYALDSTGGAYIYDDTTGRFNYGPSQESLRTELQDRQSYTPLVFQNPTSWEAEGNLMSEESSGEGAYAPTAMPIMNGRNTGTLGFNANDATSQWVYTDELSTLNYRAGTGISGISGIVNNSLNSAARNYSFLGQNFSWGGWGHLGGNLLEGIQWAGIALGLVSGLASLLGDDNQDLVEPLGQAIAAGILAGKATYGLIMSLDANKIGGFNGNTGVGGWIANHANAVSIGVGLVTAYLVLANNYEDTETKQQQVQFQCLSWQAPRGGADCDRCNGDALRPCSEYRCRSLGQTCKLINAGTGKDKCIDGSIDDVTSPGIKPDPEALTLGYSYADVKPRPPGGSGTAGMRIVSEEGACLKAFTPFKFGIITTDNGQNGVETQPAQCKIDMQHTNKMDEMQYYMGGDNLFVEKHNESISLPGTAVLNAQFPDFKNDGEYTLYIRCRDGNGNENRDEFSVSFCIDKTPDLTAPVIKTTSIPSGSPVLYKVDNLTTELYINEPATCKWSRKDADYSNMENDMTCSNAVWEMNAESLYTCQAKLTGIKDKETNQFYFRCQDSNNNQMQQSYSYTLEGTQPLNIIKVNPNGTIGGSTSTVTATLEVQTDNGHENGNSECYYSPTQDSGFIKFFDTGSNIHKQPLDLTDGNYKYYLRCIDAGGNTDNSSVSFRIFVDRYAPALARVYSLESKLVVITEEESSCSYSTSSCNFDLSKKEGISMPYPNTINHYAEWKTDQTYYIKCEDKYGNSPDPNECSIIVRPYELKSY